MTGHALQRRIDRMLEALEHGPLLEKKLTYYAREGLNRKLAIARKYAINHGMLPADYSEQCRAIDQDIERHMSPAERAARAAYQGSKVDSLATLKKELSGLVECYRPDVLDAIVEQCVRDIEQVYRVRLVD